MLPESKTPPPERSAATARWHEPRILAFLILVATLPYLNTLVNSFVYDDGVQILANPYVQSWRYLPEIFGSNVWSFLGQAGVTNHYRPLMTLTYLLSWQWFGPVPFGFHLVNLIFHAAVVWMVYRVTLQIFAEQSLAVVAAALFALHPVHTESVAWVAGLTDLQLGLFYLLTFSQFLRAGERPGRPPLRVQLAMGAAFILALLSKETSATLPVLATVYEYGYRSDRCRTALRDKLLRFAVLWVILAAYLVFRVSLLGAIAPVLRRNLVTWPEALYSAPALIAQYIWKLLWPAQLCAFYVFRKSASLADPRTLAGIAVLAPAAVFFFLLWKRARPASFSLLWFLIALAPVLNARWMAANVFAERYLYLPSLGFCWLIAWLWTQARARVSGKSVMTHALTAALLLVCGLYALRAVTRNQDWRDDETLYAQTLSLSPDAYLIRSNLGAAYWNRGERAAAVREWRRALESQPEDVVLLNNLGLAAATQHNLPEAEALFQKAMRIKPAFAESYFNLGRAYEDAGRLADAEREYRAAIRESPLHAGAQNQLGRLLLRTNRVSEAEQLLRQACEALPNADSYAGLGLVFLRQNQLDTAEQSFRKALALNPYHLEALVGLGDALAAEGRPQAALQEYEKALKLAPADASLIEKRNAAAASLPR